MIAMQRFMVQADETLIERLKQRAADRGISVAAVVREALERELGPTAKPPEIRSIGAFASEGGDLSRRASADEYEPPSFRS